MNSTFAGKTLNAIDAAVTTDGFNNGNGWGSLWVPSTSYAGNIFGSFQIYISNYTSSTAKSFSVDTVAPNNSSTIFRLGMQAGSSPETTAITGFRLQSDTYQTYSTISIYKITAD